MSTKLPESRVLYIPKLQLLFKKKQTDIPDNVCRTNSYAVNVNDFYIYDMIIINVFYSKVQYLNH